MTEGAGAKAFRALALYLSGAGGLRDDLRYRGFLIFMPAAGVAPFRSQLHDLLFQLVEGRVSRTLQLSIGPHADEGMLPGVKRDLDLVQEPLLGEDYVRFSLALALHQFRDLLQLGLQLGPLFGRKCVVPAGIVDFHCLSQVRDLRH